MPCLIPNVVIQPLVRKGIVEPIGEGKTVIRPSASRRHRKARTSQPASRSHDNGKWLNRIYIIINVFITEPIFISITLVLLGT